MIIHTLKQIGLDAVEISDALESYDSSILTEENYKLLLQIIPTKKEIEEVVTFNGDVLKDLYEADQFILIISGTPFFKERIKTILYSYNYRKNSTYLLKEIEKYCIIFKFLREDKDLNRFLTIMGGFIVDKNKVLNSSKINLKLSLMKILKITENELDILPLIDNTIKYIYNEIKEPKILDFIEKLKILINWIIIKT